MRPRIASLLLATVLVSALLGLGVRAVLVDSETSRGNRLEAGSMDLKLKDGDETYRDGVHVTWWADHVYPGWINEYAQSLTLSNFGSVDADHVELSCSYSLVQGHAEPGDPGNDAHSFARCLEIERLEYRDTGWWIDLATGKVGGSPPYPPGYQPSDWLIEDIDQDGSRTLYDLAGQVIDNLPAPWKQNLGPYHLELTLRCPVGTGNEIQGDRLLVDFHLTLNQSKEQ